MQDLSRVALGMQLRAGQPVPARRVGLSAQQHQSPRTCFQESQTCSVEPVQVLVEDGAVGVAALEHGQGFTRGGARGDHTHVLVGLVGQAQRQHARAADAEHHAQLAAAGQHAIHAHRKLASSPSALRATSSDPRRSAATRLAPSSTLTSSVSQVGWLLLPRLAIGPPPELTLSPCCPRPTPTTRAWSRTTLAEGSAPFAGAWRGVLYTTTVSPGPITPALAVYGSTGIVTCTWPGATVV